MKCPTCKGNRVIGCVEISTCPDCLIDENLKQEIIDDLKWMIQTLTWQQDEINGDEHGQGSYSPQLTRAIELLKRLEEL